VNHRFFISFALGLASAWALPLYAAEAYSTYQTASGCSISDAFTETEFSWLPPGWERAKTWSGACIGGKAEGWGLYTTAARSGGSDMFVLTLRGFAHDGKLIGYARMISKTKTGSMSSWLYTADGQTVGGNTKMDLAITDLAMDAPTVAVPTEVRWLEPSAPPDNSRYLATSWAAKRKIMFVAESCSRHMDRFPECARGSTQADSLVFYIEDLRWDERRGVGVPSKKLTFCPNPRSLSGCATTVEQVVAPHRQEMLDFIQRTGPAVNAQLASSRQTLMQARASSAGSKAGDQADKSSEGSLKYPDGKTFVGFLSATGQPLSGRLYNGEGALIEQGEYARNELIVGHRFDSNGQVQDRVDRLAEQRLSAQREREAAVKVAAEQAQRAQQEAQQKAFRDSLQKMNAGQLYAKADELATAGETQRSREVLRALISRFPDHALAVEAAKQMSNTTAQALPSSAPLGQESKTRPARVFGGGGWGGRNNIK
jgi:hypothetical protein